MAYCAIFWNTSPQAFFHLPSGLTLLLLLICYVYRWAQWRLSSEEQWGRCWSSYYKAFLNGCLCGDEQMRKITDSRKNSPEATWSSHLTFKNFLQGSSLLAFHFLLMSCFSFKYAPGKERQALLCTFVSQRTRSAHSIISVLTSTGLYAVIKQGLPPHTVMRTIVLPTSELAWNFAHSKVG